MGYCIKCTQLLRIKRILQGPNWKFIRRSTDTYRNCKFQEFFNSRRTGRGQMKAEFVRVIYIHVHIKPKGILQLPL